MAEQAAAERLGLVDRQASLNAALLAEDQLGMVVRAHIHIEHEVIEFIRARLQPPEALDAIELDYSGRVKLALALGLPAEFKAALGFIGTLRNRFAHRLGAVITKQDADNFDQALGPGNAITAASYRATHDKLRPGERPQAVRDHDPLDRVILYVVTLWGGVAVAAAKAKGIGA